MGWVQFIFSCICCYFKTQDHRNGWRKFQILTHWSIRGTKRLSNKLLLMFQQQKCLLTKYREIGVSFEIMKQDIKLFHKKKQKQWEWQNYLIQSIPNTTSLPIAAVILEVVNIITFGEVFSLSIWVSSAFTTWQAVVRSSMNHELYSNF